MVASIFCTSVLAQTKKDTTTATAKAPVIAVTPLIEKFFRDYKESSNAAVQNIFTSNPNMDASKFTELVSQMDKARELVGKYQGKELIVQKKAGNSLVVYSYLVKHDLQPLRYTFMFYKPKNDWMIYRLYFDDKVESELQDATKL
ncbi:hypothetical protein DJ568_02595 [Mucilaginibacter hurinus]|uniref:DUF3887 domain-containing protein n=2 Tax=Mucilaginibacter hurinus TaxID=2201324 RepID=A0A367GVR5_9SPHI|nr:hypothetical protein DJ568_02595 [Mucilaginibacter hurinus]